MKKINITLLTAILMTAIACNSSPTGQQQTNNPPAESDLIFEKGEKITNDNFTGTAWLNDLITPDDENPNAVGSVTFEPGARTRWHSHPAGQIILALDGVGYYQEEGKPVEIIHKGGVVKCPHNIPHWHGASPDSHFIQIAITGRENGPTVWYEKVTDEEYHSYKK